MHRSFTNISLKFAKIDRAQCSGKCLPTIFTFTKRTVTFDIDLTKANDRDSSTVIVDIKFNCASELPINFAGIQNEGQTCYLNAAL